MEFVLAANTGSNNIQYSNRDRGRDWGFVCEKVAGRGGVW